MSGEKARQEVIELSLLREKVLRCQCQHIKTVDIEALEKRINFLYESDVRSRLSEMKEKCAKVAEGFRIGEIAAAIRALEIK